MKKYYITQELADTLVKQGACLRADAKGFYVEGWTQGMASIDLFDNNNTSTYLCWYDGTKAVGVQAYLNQFKEET